MLTNNYRLAQFLGGIHGSY